MPELSIQLLQFLGILVPVMFASVRFVNEKESDAGLTGGIAGKSETDESGITTWKSYPKPTVLLGVAFVSLISSMLLLVINVSLYGIWEISSVWIFALASATLFVGLLVLGVFIVKSLPVRKARII